MSMKTNQPGVLMLHWVTLCSPCQSFCTTREVCTISACAIQIQVQFYTGNYLNGFAGPLQELREVCFACSRCNSVGSS